MQACESLEENGVGLGRLIDRSADSISRVTSLSIDSAKSVAVDRFDSKSIC